MFSLTSRTHAHVCKRAHNIYNITFLSYHNKNHISIRFLQFFLGTTNCVRITLQSNIWLILRFTLLKTHQPPSANLFSMLHINRVSLNSFKYNTPSFRTRRHFSHHSVRDNSLHKYSSLAGETIGTHIEKYRPLIMPLVHR